MSGDTGPMDGGNMGSVVAMVSVMTIESMVTIAPRLGGSLAKGVSGYGGGSTLGMFHGEGGIESGGSGVHVVKSMVSVVSVVTVVVSVRISGSLAQGVAGYGRGSTAGMSNGEFPVGECGTS